MPLLLLPLLALGLPESITPRTTSSQPRLLGVLLRNGLWSRTLLLWAIKHTQLSQRVLHSVVRAGSVAFPRSEFIPCDSWHDHLRTGSGRKSRSHSICRRPGADHRYCLPFIDWVARTAIFVTIIATLWRRDWWRLPGRDQLTFRTNVSPPGTLDRSRLGAGCGPHRHHGRTSSRWFIAGVRCSNPEHIHRGFNRGVWRGSADGDPREPAAAAAGVGSIVGLTFGHSSPGVYHYPRGT